MSILTGEEIKRQIDLGRIWIDPFSEDQLNPNSYNVRLGKQLLLYSEIKLDVTKKPRSMIIDIPDSGIELVPGTGYLGTTLETTRTDFYAPMIGGRSTMGRYFVTVHQTAGFGDVGFSGQWTLELMAMYLPVRIYAGMKIAQIYFETVVGYIALYKGRYQNQSGVKGPEPLIINPSISTKGEN